MNEKARQVKKNVGIIFKDYPYASATLVIVCLIIGFIGGKVL